MNRCWRLLCRFKDNTVSSSKGGSNFPCCHKKWEVPRNNLPNHSQRLMKMICYCIMINLTNSAFLCTNDTCKITKVINGRSEERRVGKECRAEGPPGHSLSKHREGHVVRD